MFEFLKNKLPQAQPQRVLHVGKNFSVPMSLYAQTGERDAILASSGMGKSYLTGVIIEQTLENNGIVLIIDPEGEHFTLAERYPMMIVGGEHGNLPLDEDAVDLYIEAMLEHGISAVFDLSDHVDEDQQHLYGVIAEHLFNLEQKYRTKVRLVVEEAQIYAPQRNGLGGKRKKGRKDPVQASQKIAKRGRKRAIDSLWATQRPASLNKDILSQCNRFWFGGITSEQDYKAIKPFLTEAGITFAHVKALKPGEFYYFGKGETRLLKVRKRLCQHAGATPEAFTNFNATTNNSLDQALSVLAEAVSSRAAMKQEEMSESKKLARVIMELENENARLQEELEQEKTATKVIERLGSKPPASRTRRKTGFQRMDELDGIDVNHLGMDDPTIEGGSGLSPTKINLDTKAVSTLEPQSITRPRAASTGTRPRTRRLMNAVPDEEF
ncbi:MAG: DUF87 domain-containing protein [Vampirovibrionales bacterium]|nr:DUF87 domain-containing protein [Vampirovibrionales bacterium]